jgi:uroporphyrinogen-III synthase
MLSKTHILSTRPLHETIVAEAAALDIVIDTLSFIQTSPIISDEVAQQVTLHAQHDATVVFTSMNAVEAVINLLNDERPFWEIYCIGDTTGNLVSDYFGSSAIAGTANNALALAAIMLLDGIKEAVFFCGDLRRDELPETLKTNNVTLHEVVVYRTIATPQAVEKNYDGILFFSPSAVESFFTANNIAGNTILFAIGDTTGDTIKKFSNNRVITGVIPGKEALAKQAIEHFAAEREWR